MRGSYQAKKKKGRKKKRLPARCIQQGTKKRDIYPNEEINDEKGKGKRRTQRRNLSEAKEQETKQQKLEEKEVK